MPAFAKRVALLDHSGAVLQHFSGLQAEIFCRRMATQRANGRETIVLHLGTRSKTHALRLQPADPGENYALLRSRRRLGQARLVRTPQAPAGWWELPPIADSLQHFFQPQV
jgi:hypothetical protein